MKIKNRKELLSSGDVTGKKIILDIAERTLQKLDAYQRIKSITRMDGSVLHIGECQWDLTQKDHVYLVGAGKACNHMAMAFDEILGNYLTQGIAIVKILEKTDRFQKTKVFVGGHPIPNTEGLQACWEILSLVDHAGPNDLFICLMSGGSSSLMSCPLPGISLEDEIKTTDLLLKSGAGIREINAVRRHISQMNGGMLARRIQHRGAELIGVSISDAVGTPATGDIGIPCRSFKATPIGADDTTLDDARHAIQNYALQECLPESVVHHIMDSGEEAETPKAFPNNTYFLLNSLPDSCLYAKEAAEELGIPAMVLSSFIEGEGKDVGRVFASLAREIQTYGNPVKAPCVIIASGEATTTISSDAAIEGHGGPGEELALGFAFSAQYAPGCALLSIDSEGTDGTSTMAGGLADSKTIALAQTRNVDIFRALRTHGSYEALAQLDGAVFTGNTGTNLCDLHIMYVAEPSAPEAGARIRSVHARQILDCKCRPMVEVDVITENGAVGTGAAPTGSSVGIHESFVLRDGNITEYNGLSVHKAVDHVNRIIAPKLIGMDVRNQHEIDEVMIALDGTPDKHVLGGNAIYSVSVAAYRAAAAYERVPLYQRIARGPVKTVPIPSFNVLNGGKNNGIVQAINEFIVMPYRAADIEQAVEIAVKIFQRLGKVISKYTGKPALQGGSCGWAAPSEDPEVCLDLIQQAIDQCGYTKECAFALDCAASEMYDKETHLYYLNGKRLTSAELIDYYKRLTEKYSFVFIEDMLSEDDWDGFSAAHREIKRTYIIADDFTVSNRERIMRAAGKASIDGFILKPNQVGTITEALEAHDYAKRHGLFSITSGRSGGVIGDVVMDLAVGLQIPFIKNGCPRSGERIDKLNYLLRVKDNNPDCHMAKIDDIVRFEGR